MNKITNYGRVGLTEQTNSSRRGIITLVDIWKLKEIYGNNDDKPIIEEYYKRIRSYDIRIIDERIINDMIILNVIFSNMHCFNENNIQENDYISSIQLF